VVCRSGPKKHHIRNEPSCAHNGFVLNARHRLIDERVRPRGGVVTQRTANPDKV
jgi:hypothetical protein